MAGLSAGSGLSAGKELSPSVGNTLLSGAQLTFNGFSNSTPPTPPTDGILLENNTDFLMLENNTYYLLQET